MKKVLFVTTRLIYPINDGRKVVLYNYCKGLAEKCNCEVRLFSLIEDKERKVKQPDFISKVYFGDVPTKVEKVINLAINSILLNKWPLQVSLYYSRNTKKQLNKVIDEYNPDIVIADMARSAEYLKDLDGEIYNKILDLDDILSKRYYRQAKSNIVGNGVVGAYSDKLPKIINNMLKSPKLSKYVLKKESQLLSRYEISVSQHFKSVIFVSPIEAQYFNEIIGEEKSYDITIGVDYKYFSEKKVEIKKKNHIVFLGNMYVAHNKDTIKNFIDNVFPKVLEYNPRCILRIVGRCPETFREELSKNSNIEVTGEVDDIRIYIQECSVAIAPLVYGSGIKTKILETMAMGVPVITNDIGCEGLNIKHNKEIILENNEENLACTICKLLEDEALQNEISNNAKAFIKKFHSWDNILERFKDII